MKIREFAIVLIISSLSHAGSATFSGRILNGTRDSSAVAGQAVALHYFKADAHAPQEIARTLSAGNGRYIFSIPALDTSAHYLATSEYQGVAYYSDPAHFSASARFHYDIVLFDSTHSAAGVVGLMHHLFLQDAGEGLAVRETRVLNNPTSKTIIDAIQDTHGHSGILRIDLASWTQEITPIAGRFGSDLMVHEHTLYDVGVFEPGNRQLSFAYQLPWQKDRALLVVEIGHPTRSVDFFVDDQGLSLQGEGLSDHGPFSIRGTAYHRYGLSDVPAGTRLQLQVVRQSVAAESLPPWLTLLATAVLLLFGISLARAFAPKKEQPLGADERAQLLKERQELIERIAALEASASFSSESGMQQERSSLFQRVLRLESRLQAPAGKK